MTAPIGSLCVLADEQRTRAGRLLAVVGDVARPVRTADGVGGERLRPLRQLAGGFWQSC